MLRPGKDLRTVGVSRKMRVYFNVKTKEYIVRAKDATDESGDAVFSKNDKDAAFKHAREVK